MEGALFNVLTSYNASYSACLFDAVVGLLDQLSLLIDPRSNKGSFKILAGFYAHRVNDLEHDLTGPENWTQPALI